MTNDERRPLPGTQAGSAADFWNSWLRAVTGNNQELLRKCGAASKFKVVPGGFKLHAQLERQDIPEALNCLGNFLKAQENSYTLKKKK